MFHLLLLPVIVALPPTFKVAAVATPVTLILLKVEVPVVVIPGTESGPLTPLKLEPSPLKLVAVITPVTLMPPAPEIVPVAGTTAP